MGNYSTLWIAKDKEKYNEDTDEYLEVKYAIPLFWIALFTQDDIHKTHYEDGDPYFFFETTIERARDNFQKRIQLWAELYNDEKAGVLAELFLNFLGRYPNHDVIFNVDDVLSMYLSFENEGDKVEMIDMIQTIDQLNINPKSEMPFKHWLPSPFNFSSMKTRYLELDGMGEELLPCHEVDEWLHQNELLAIESQPPSDNIEIDWSLDEVTFYRLLMTKGDVLPSNLMGFQHRYLFLAQIKDSKNRTILLKLLLLAEITYFIFFWFILTLTCTILSWVWIGNTYFKYFVLFASVLFTTWLFYKKIVFLIKLLKHIKPIIT